MSGPWYSFFVGDYARKTAHLSLMEHGAYRLMLDHYYATQTPLPSKNVELYRICRAHTPSERRAVLSVIDKFFIKNGSMLRHERCDSEIEKQLKYKESQSAKALLRHNRGTATAMQPTPTPTIESNYKPPTPLNVDKSDGGLNKNNSGGSGVGFNILDRIDRIELAVAKSIAPGWDFHNLVEIYNGGVKQGTRTEPSNPAKAFPAWIRKYTKGKASP